MIPGTYWKLKINVNGYERNTGEILSTQVKAGRNFEILSIGEINDSNYQEKRFKVRLLEDGYICWLKKKDISKQSEKIKGWKPNILSKEEIKLRIPKILDWIEKTSKLSNTYLWGGTLGPNFDCSGLVQTGFANQEIWIPRDAYQQEKFCTTIFVDKELIYKLKLGDLLFFGSQKKCTHVAIYKGKGKYWHSSGQINGRNGIGIDELQPKSENHISSYYWSIFRSAGRINSCYDGRTIS